MEGDPVQFGVRKDHNIIPVIKQEFLEMRPLFRKKIQYVCDSFMQACFKSASKLANVIKEESVTLSGTLLFSVPTLGNITVFYHIDSKGWDNSISNCKINGRVFTFATRRDFPIPFLASYHRIEDGCSADYFGLEDTSAYIQFLFIFGLLLFSNFCEVETKIVEAGKKSLHKNEKYVNETKMPIEILDSTWFTTLIRSEAFTVGAESGGFFRWQRYGQNLSQRKIIWVAPFEKHGYTRKAKILVNGPSKT